MDKKVYKTVDNDRRKDMSYIPLNYGNVKITRRRKIGSMVFTYKDGSVYITVTE